MNDKKIDFWINNNQNVLFIGKHGVGKTAIVKEAFERHGLNYRYFSASTMDPWVDFIGVPKEKNLISSENLSLVKDLMTINHNLAVEWIVSNWGLSDASAKEIIKGIDNKSVPYLELIRPEVFATGDIEALFFDEFNRSPKKVRNAVMELLQFKSINGHVFPKLKIIWAAINPEDDLNLYDVEKIDPAQRDRFHVFVDVPYRPNIEWFRKRYGTKTANAAVQWWDELENKDEVSPRRLQYALDTYVNKGDMRDVLPLSSNISKLSSSLNTGPMLEKLEELLAKNNEEETKAFLNNENNFAAAIKYIKKSDALSKYFLPLIPKEKISVILSQNDSTSSFVINNSIKIPIFKEVCEDILKANTNNSLVKKIRKHFTENQLTLEESQEKKCVSFYNKNADPIEWTSFLKSLENIQITKEREKIIQDIKHLIPKNMSRKDVRTCLEIIYKIDPQPTEIASGAQGLSNTWSNLIGVVNHLIYEGVQNRPTASGAPEKITLSEFVYKNMEILLKLNTSIKLGGYEKDVIKNEKQLNSLTYQ